MRGNFPPLIFLSLLTFYSYHLINNLHSIFITYIHKNTKGNTIYGTRKHSEKRADLKFSTEKSKVRATLSKLNPRLSLNLTAFAACVSSKLAKELPSLTSSRPSLMST